MKIRNFHYLFIKSKTSFLHLFRNNSTLKKVLIVFDFMKINKHTPRKLPPTHRSILPDTIAASAMSILASDTYIREIERAKSLRILLAHFQEFETTDIFLMLEEPTIHLGKTITLINILMERAKNNASIYDKLIIYFWRETDLKLCEEMLCCFRDHLIQNKKSQHLF